jgi:CRP-like cAMP-binding protein
MSFNAFAADRAARFRQPAAQAALAPNRFSAATGGNMVLAELGEVAAGQIKRQSRQTRFAARAWLQGAEAPSGAVLFPDSGLIAIQAPGAEGALSEVGTVGADGALGLLEALSGAPSPFTHFTLTPTAAWVTPGVVVQRLFRSDAAVADVLWRHLALAQTRARNDIACASHHRGLERLADRLLAYRQEVGDRLPVRQDDLAHALGMTRTSVTALLTTLANSGLIRTGRGWIQIIAAPRLADIACGCRQAHARDEA